MIRRLPLGTLVLLVISVGLNVALAQKVKSLRRTVEAVKAERNLKIGQQLPDIPVVTLDGKDEKVRLRNKQVQTVVYVFSPSCSWCYRNEANVQALAQAASEGRFRLVGLSITDSGIRAYVSEHRMTFPVYTVRNDTMAAYRLGGTPQTLLIAADGRLLKNWRGAYQNELKVEIEKELRLTLPGLLELPARPPQKTGP